jgi:hypothetical protein
MTEKDFKSLVSTNSTTRAREDFPINTAGCGAICPESPSYVFGNEGNTGTLYGIASPEIVHKQFHEVFS